MTDFIISKEQFDKGSGFFSKFYGGWMDRGGFSDQVDWVNEIGIDLLDDDVFSYDGVFVSSDRWENPDNDDIENFLEFHIEHPEFRLLKFRFDGKLSGKETQIFKEWIVNHYTDPETSDGIYTATVRYDENILVIFTSRRGSSWEGVRCEVLGIFRSLEEGRSFMFADKGIYL